MLCTCTRQWCSHRARVRLSWCRCGVKRSPAARPSQRGPIAAAVRYQRSLTGVPCTHAGCCGCSAGRQGGRRSQALRAELPLPLQRRASPAPTQTTIYLPRHHVLAQPRPQREGVGFWHSAVADQHVWHADAGRRPRCGPTNENRLAPQSAPARRAALAPCCRQSQGIGPPACHRAACRAALLLPASQQKQQQHQHALRPTASTPGQGAARAARAAGHVKRPDAPGRRPDASTPLVAAQRLTGTGYGYMLPGEECSNGSHMNSYGGR